MERAVSRYKNKVSGIIKNCVSQMQTMHGNLAVQWSQLLANCDKAHVCKTPRCNPLIYQ